MTNEINSDTNSTFTEFNFEGFKNTETINCGSQMLLNYLMYLEWDPTVQFYFQPVMAIAVEYQNAEYEAKIELWVNYHDGRSELVHFLDRHWLQLINDHPMLYARFDKFCREGNLRYAPMSPFETDCEPLLSNLTVLWNNAKHELRMTHVALINNFFEERKETNFGKLRTELARAGFFQELAYTLIFHKLVIADILYFPISEKTIILSGHVYPVADGMSPLLILEKLNSKAMRVN